jgi:hypothetical protein
MVKRQRYEILGGLANRDLGLDFEVGQWKIFFYQTNSCKAMENMKKSAFLGSREMGILPELADIWQTFLVSVVLVYVGKS